MHKRRNAVGSRIRQARLSESPKATQKDISARLQLEGINISESSVGKIELGLRPVTDLQLIALAKVLKVSCAWLLGEVNIPQRLK